MLKNYHILSLPFHKRTEFSHQIVERTSVSFQSEGQNITMNKLGVLTTCCIVLIFSFPLVPVKLCHIPACLLRLMAEAY